MKKMGMQKWYDSVLCTKKYKIIMRGAVGRIPFVCLVMTDNDGEYYPMVGLS